ncbi:hypothetical protein [Corynebacterium hadale]
MDTKIQQLNWSTELR